MLRSDTLTIPRSPPRVRLTVKELLDLPEYSSSLPTGLIVGKRWRRDGNFWARREFAHLHFWDGTPEPEDCGEEWWIGQYVPDAEPGYVGITWTRVDLVRDP